MTRNCGGTHPFPNRGRRWCGWWMPGSTSTFPDWDWGISGWISRQTVLRGREARRCFSFPARGRRKNAGRWRFLELARYARGEGWSVVFQTGPCERDLGRQAADAGFAVCDTPSLARMAGQMLLAWCVAGNDTGPMHLAAMLGIPTLTLHFHGSGETWFPYGSDERAEHVALSPGCARARCPDRCREAASCGKRIPFGTVEAAWKALCEGERNLKRKTTNKRSKSPC